MNPIWLLVTGAVMFAAGLATAAITLLSPPAWLDRKAKNARSFDGVRGGIDSLGVAPAKPSTLGPNDPPPDFDDGPPLEPVYLIVAATYQIADAWRVRQGFAPRQFRYVTGGRDLRGWGERATVVMIEGWSRTRAAGAVQEIHLVARELQAVGATVMTGREWDERNRQRPNYQVVAGDVVDVDQDDPWSHEAPQQPA